MQLTGTDIQSARFQPLFEAARNLTADGLTAALWGLSTAGSGGFSAAQYVSEKLGPYAPAAPRVAERPDPRAQVQQAREIAKHVLSLVGHHELPHFFDFLIAVAPYNLRDAYNALRQEMGA